MTSQTEWEAQLRARATKNRVALVCGTGVTAAVSESGDCSTWGELIESGLEYVGSLSAQQGVQAKAFATTLRVADSDAYIAVAEWLSAQLRRESEGEYFDWLRRTVGALQVGTRDFDFLANLNVPILTTNYDSLLEEVTGRAAMTWTDKNRLDKFHDEPESLVFHLHGYWEHPESVIFSGSDYQRMASNRATALVMESMASTHTMLMVGYGAGLQDPNFGNFIRWFAENYDATIRHIFVLCREADLPDKTLNGKVAYLSYGSEYSDLPTYLADVFGAASDLEMEPSTSADAEAIGNPDVVDVLDALPQTVKDLANDLLGTVNDRPSQQTSMLNATADAIEHAGAALVSAVTGTGKTTVARTSMNLAVARNQSALMILPTKALVAQEAREWEAWERAWIASDRRIRVYPSSRDYPENDSPVSKGRFEIALAIYEKVAGFLISGQRTLGTTGLLVVDELQTLVEDKARAAKLEGLLTMVKLQPADVRPAVLGLSATMSEGSTELLRAWLGVDTFHFIQSADRPIPLDTYVVDHSKWWVQRDAHFLALPQPDSVVPAAEEYRHQLTERFEDLGLAGNQVQSLGTANLAVALVERLLAEDEERRILVFVPGRTAAQELAQTIQRVLDRTMGSAARRGSPWAVGRFASDHVSEAEASLRGGALAHCDIPLYADVIRGLRTGVAYHSARLAPKLRRDLEREFNDPHGLLRVLVATDTLAMGVNLPADVVIATSLSGYGSDRKLRLSTPAELDNKAGRAGRRGLARRERGEFYLLVPRAKELQAVKGMTAGGMEKLSTIEGVYKQFVAGIDRSPKVNGQIRELDDVALLTLHVLTADGFARRSANLEARVENILNSLLARQEADVRLPTPLEVIGRLEALLLLQSSEEGKAKPTRLGEALARAGLQLSSAHILERISRLATEGAGDIDLLFNACRSDEIADVTAWVGLPSVHPRHYPSLKERIVTYALAYCHESADRRRYCAALFNRYPQPEEYVLEGQKVNSVELATVLESDSEEIDDQDANALLRAVVAFEWSRGIPFDDIKARLSDAIRSEERERNGREVEVRLHFSDVEQLCEQIAGVVRGSAELSFSESHDWSNRVRLLALQVEVGLPAWLAPVVKLRIDSLHRNRLAALWRQVPPAALPDILDLQQLVELQGITEQDRSDAREKLERRQMEELAHKHFIAQEWTAEVVPGFDGMNFEELGEELSDCKSSISYARMMGSVFNGLGVDVVYSEYASGSALMVACEGQGIGLKIPEGELGREEVSELADDDIIVVLRTLIRPSGVQLLSRGPTTARFVLPESLLSLIARLVSVRGPGIQPSELIGRLQAMRVSILDAESAASWSDQPAGPPPFVDPMPRLEGGSPLAASLEDDAG